ncbi:20838_t:CDS:2 [Gigaspora margarita]|uniref:20838_t:CDS:1 n=1 Tax=Gigaspora margarita TaxID=4874 RepID=A0ABN7VA55_GIGMA|nr:20838_t:CDS:2 [Gigaspora margarita]
MYVKRINKGIESIKRSSAIMICKMDVGKEKIDKNKIKNTMVNLETVKPKVGNVNEDKGKDANVTEVCKNNEVFRNLTDDMSKLNTRGFCGTGEVPERYSSPKKL